MRNEKDVRYEKINMDNYFYSISVKENSRKINNEHAAHISYIYIYIHIQHNRLLF